MLKVYSWAPPNDHPVQRMLARCPVAKRAIPVDIGVGVQCSKRQRQRR